MSVRIPYFYRAAPVFAVALLWAMAAHAQQTVPVDFVPLETISDNDALETSAPVIIDAGPRRVIAIEAGSPAAQGGGGNELVEYTEQSPGNWVRRVLASGDIFSLSRRVAFLNGLYFFTVVQNFNAFLYQWNPGTGDWDTTQLTNSGNVANATLAVTGVLLTIAFLDQTLALWDWTGTGFVASGTTYSDVGTGFNGYKIPRSAVGDNGDRCTMFQRASTGVLVAACLIASVAQTATLASLGPPGGFNPYIETTAIFTAGHFFFSWFTTSGDVRLARLTAATLAVTAITLGALPALNGGFPGMAMEIGPAGRLFLFWAAAAAVINPQTLAFSLLGGYPFVLVGALAVTLIAGLLVLVGPGSNEITSFDPATVAILGQGVESVPVMGMAGVVALVILMAGLGAWGLRDRTRIVKGKT